MWVALFLNPKHAYKKTRNKGKGKQWIHFRQIGKPTVCLHALKKNAGKCIFKSQITCGTYSIGNG